jgi:hypothetical protein
MEKKTFKINFDTANKLGAHVLTSWLEEKENYLRLLNLGHK